MSDRLEDRLKSLIVETLDLEGMDPSEMMEDAPLFNGGLDLDSIDGLELVLQIEKQFGIKIASSEESRKALGSIRVLADFIRENGSPVS